MADFKDTIRELLDHPGIQFGAADQPASLVFFEKDTLPREEFSFEPVANTMNRTSHDISDPPSNDDRFAWTIGTTTYAVVISLDGGATTPAPEDFSVVAAVTTAMTHAQKLTTIVAAMRVLPNVTARVLSGEIVIFGDEDRTSDVAAAGTAIASTSSVSVTDSGMVFPPGYRPGDRWAKNEYLIVLQTMITGGDDTHSNLTVMCRADFTRLAAEFDDLELPDDLCSDNFRVSYPYDGDSREISWTFLTPETGGYTRAPAATPHPWYVDALLVGVQSEVSHGTRTVTHTYREIGPAAEQHKQGYVVDYECSKEGADLPANRYPVVTLRLEVRLNSYKPALPGSACPIVGATAEGTNAELDFNTIGLVLREPPKLESRGPVWGVAVMTYSRLPSWVKTTKVVVDFPEDAEVYVSEFYASAPYSAPAIDSAAAWVASTYVTKVEVIPIDCGVVRVRVEHAKVPSDFVEWDTEGVRFPPLYPAAVSFPPTAVPYGGGRVEFSESVPARVEYSFTRTPDTLAATMPDSQRFESYLLLGVQDALENQDLTEEEISRSISRAWWHRPNILHDTFFIEDPDTGSIVTTVTPSSPSSTTYRLWIALRQRFVVRDVLTKWRGKIYMRARVSVVAR